MKGVIVLKKMHGIYSKYSIEPIIRNAREQNLFIFRVLFAFTWRIFFPNSLTKFCVFFPILWRNSCCFRNLLMKLAIFPVNDKRNWFFSAIVWQNLQYFWVQIFGLNQTLGFQKIRNIITPGEISDEFFFFNES